MAVAFRDNVVEITADAAEQSIVTGDVAAGGFSNLRIRKVRWVVTTGAVAGDNAQILRDTGAGVIWESVAVTAGQFIDESDFVHGFDLRALDATGLRAVVDRGTLYLYLGGSSTGTV
jgi:hypothetical protein